MALEASETIATRFVRAIEEKFAPLQGMPLFGAPREQLEFCTTAREQWQPLGHYRFDAAAAASRHACGFRQNIWAENPKNDNGLHDLINNPPVEK